MNDATMTTNSHSTDSLYAALLGRAWADVDPVVRRGHFEGVALRRTGSFRIRRGNTRLARLLLSILRMPKASEATATELVVTQQGDGEQWVREFGDSVLKTTQCQGREDVLIERFQLVELRFRLEVHNGSLIYRVVGAALQLGFCSIPLPQRLWPIVEAQEKAAGLDRVYTSVSVTVPLAGFLISYEGDMGDEVP